MPRTERLFELLQILRRHRGPVSGASLAQEMGISLRTLYRDIGALQALGAEIEGEPGVGYVLKPGFMLPPLMFSEEEIEALALGARWVARRTDDSLSRAAGEAMAKIAAVLPDDLRRRLDDASLLVGRGWERPQKVALSLLREAIRTERRLLIVYRDEKGARSERVVWPFLLGFFESTRVLAAWCELRRDFRHFRADRIETAMLEKDRYPRRRQALLKEWRQSLLTEFDNAVAYGQRPRLKERETAMTKELVFYTNPQSRGGIVHWMLEEVGAPYRIEVLEYGTTMKAPDYLAINPMGKVPAIRHGDAVVTECAAICAYLADAFPDAGLAPIPQERGAYYRWLFFAAGPMEAAFSNHAVGWDPDPDRQRMFGYGTYELVIETLANHLKGRKYVAGDRFTAADVYLGSHIGWGMQFGTVPKRPEFEAYWNGLKDRPAHRRSEEQTRKLMAKEAWA
ncbi:HTH domain-containing protein [Amphiplicatus metriothermophilus]|uniref:Predicted DNA-binding transcriptional regulator YafY, contains an HTH and WYL domains n=1 Tax=Amphiplicatus metriothermophilus TaxID=1519374 RepID=A0A239PP69_9PROT|nr:HTH domain-containing protein [Amphiplicatus metriothermophilus]MBB5518744.1 putative DNA-binding transcriptional regulator YafY/glutathione S-transferase [Amphiplicatus metriothermophilus]SNT72101.1 Predicted DNA-binding transcriptional regulator YafY, contains an HTH and WYL domains [Amphiplicatus metriothermophilus]